MTRLADLLSDRFGGAQAFFCNSGAEAIEAAIKYARKATGKPGIVALENSFHGRTMGALSVTGQPAKREAFEPLVPGVSFAQLNDVASLEAAVGPDTGLIMVEPVQGEGGVNPATPGFLAAARRPRRRARRAPLLRRGPDRRRPDGDVLRLRAARRAAAPDHARQGPRQRAADRCAARGRPRPEGLRARRPRLDVRRQPGRVRGRLRRRRDGRRGAARNVRERSAQLAEALPVRGAGLLLGLETEGAGRRSSRPASTRACSSPPPARPLCA